MGITDVGTAVAAVLGLSLLVIVHETGHFIAARLSGMKVLRYSIGIGPVLAKWQPKDSPTTFQVCLVPALAYVQIAGMNPFEEIDENDPTLYPNKSLFARAFTVAAGPAANYLFASVLVFGTALLGWPHDRIGEVMPDAPAASSGLKVGDIIIKANGKRVIGWDELVQITSHRAGMNTEYVVERDGKELSFAVTPAARDGRGVIGIVRSTKPMFRSLGLEDSARAALVLPFTITVLSLEGIASLLEKPSSENLAGPVKMGQTIASQAKRGLFEYLWILIALSVSLGLFNLLPFPALDGGRLVFLGYELIARRKPNARFEAVVHTLGILLLLGLFAVVTAGELFPGKEPPAPK
jgi:regulator of sigma E protease